MPKTIFHGRDAVYCENGVLRLTVVREGGHLAEIFDKEAGVSPLWVPPWRSVEPSACVDGRHPEFGADCESKLLAGIMGHNLCLDLFGGPSAEEERAGNTAHGEASVLPYEIDEVQDGLKMQLQMPLAQMAVTRSIRLFGRWVRVRETVENLAAIDRPIGWTQHVTLGPPFLDAGTTEFRASMTESLVTDGDFGVDAYLKAATEFTWPMGPGKHGGEVDLRKMREAPASGYTAHLVSPAQKHGFFMAFSGEYEMAFGYTWKQREFPWMGIWEENRSRQRTPWNGRVVARGMEFGVSPFPETRQAMVGRGKVFGMPGFRWLPARAMQEAEYWISCQRARAIPEMLEWPYCITSQSQQSVWPSDQGQNALPYDEDTLLQLE